VKILLITRLPILKRLALGLCLYLPLPLIADQPPPVRLVAVATFPMAYPVDGAATGLQVDLIREIFRRIGRPVTIDFLPWARCIEEAKTGEVDGIFTIFKTPERESYLLYGAEALQQMPISFFARKGTGIRFDGDVAAMARYRIGVVNKTFNGPRIAQAIAAGSLTDFSESNSFETIVRMLAHGRVDLVVGFSQAVSGAAATEKLSGKIEELAPPVDVIPGFLAFTRKRDFSELEHAVDNALSAMRADGTYESIARGYGVK
jgi:polar amino acid transport system substrate-binding protein